MFWTCLVFLSFSNAVVTGEQYHFNMTDVSVKYANPNHYGNVENFHCPLNKFEYVICPSKKPGKVCICNHEPNMMIYIRHQCLYPPTSYENINLPSESIIYIRLKHKNFVSVKKDLLPQLKKPLNALNLTTGHVAFIRCMPNPDELVAAYIVVTKEVNHKVLSVDWRNEFGRSLSDGGNIEVMDAKILNHFYEFYRFWQIVKTDGQVAANKTFKIFVLVGCILSVFAITGGAVIFMYYYSRYYN